MAVAAAGSARHGHLPRGPGPRPPQRGRHKGAARHPPDPARPGSGGWGAPLLLGRGRGSKRRGPRSEAGCPRRPARSRPLFPPALQPGRAARGGRLGGGAARHKDAGRTGSAPAPPGAQRPLPPARGPRGPRLPQDRPDPRLPGGTPRPRLGDGQKTGALMPTLGDTKIRKLGEERGTQNTLSEAIEREPGRRLGPDPGSRNLGSMPWRGP